MTTLLYGEKPGADVAPGNRADAEDDPGASGTHPRLLPTVEICAVVVERAAEPTVPPPSPSSPPSPTYPPPEPWRERRSPLPSMILGLVTVAAVFAGLAIWGVAFAWSQSLSRLAQLGLMAAGGYLVAIGIAYMLSAQHAQRAQRAA